MVTAADENGDDVEDGDKKPAATTPKKVKKKKNKKKKKKEKAARKKKRKEAEESGRIGGYKPYRDHVDEDPPKQKKERDLLKFDDDDDDEEEGGLALHVNDSDEDEEKKRENHDDDDDDSSFESIDTDQRREIRNHANDLVEGRSGSVKKKKKKAGGGGPSLFNRVFGRSWGRRVKATEDEKVPLGSGEGDVDGTGDGGNGEEVRYRDEEPLPRYRDSLDAAHMATGHEGDDDLDSIADHIRMEGVYRKRGRARRCCVFTFVIAVVVGLGLVIWFDWGHFGLVEKLHHHVGGHKGSEGEATGSGVSASTGGGGSDTDPQTVTPPFDVYANVGGICSDSAVASFEGFYACRGLCDSAYCCFLPPWETHSCARTFVDQCKPYVSACAVLDRVEQPRAGAPDVATGTTKKGALPMPVATLPVLCSSSAVKKAGGLEKCNDACEPGKCCFAGQTTCGALCGTEDCLAENAFACAAYHPCIDAVAFQGGGGGPDPHSHYNETASGGGGGAVIHSKNFRFSRRRLVLEQACSKRGMAVSDACKKYCTGYECCFGAEDGGSDAMEECGHVESVCTDVGACSNFFAAKTGG
uniref:Uncharacterized protein n=1 Tax=Pseudictyota dubia TaxID=2749911 RepID=A0A7R9W709_9STRA